ncbi:BPTI/Kunitz-type proteinase inhibitor domain-containing protein [Geomobilimonas luticola]|uniref:BPTI/Kunitz domain-containing protein n=1 Tax=Geomobilimonas luticola TaxID=1114878 RepID=A0ABS5SGB7_9BACT|nr:BPTI/Kunitz-type proteinase inhibitor domain-containing protein [Geomobilimonas luticola]MBT0653067.1 BPTI/Kunitz domain-containing protein [Geomobilimonas luticola]
MKCHYAPILSLLICSLLLSSVMSYGGELPEKCRLVPVNGTCKAMMDKYYFDQKTGRCTEYFYDGCGQVVPFDTMEECRALCEPPAPAGEGPKAPVVEKSSGLAHDPVENDPRYAEVFKNIDDEVKALLADHPQRGAEGFVNIYWGTKKRVLKEKYGIDWRSPGELNPHVLFD